MRDVEDFPKPHSEAFHKGRAMSETGYVQGCERCAWLQKMASRPLERLEALIEALRAEAELADKIVRGFNFLSNLEAHEAARAARLKMEENHG